MKVRYLLIILVAMLLGSCASFLGTVGTVDLEPVDIGPKEWVYEVPGVEQAELFKRARFWIAETYNSAEAVMTFDDASTGTIKGNGTGSIQYYGYREDELGNVYSGTYDLGYIYNLSIYTKDEKAKIEFSKVSDYYDGLGLDGGADFSHREQHDKIMINFRTLAKEFEKSVREGIPTDW